MNIFGFTITRDAKMDTQDSRPTAARQVMAIVDESNVLGAILGRLEAIEIEMAGILLASGQIKVEANKLSEAVADVDMADRLLETMEQFALVLGKRIGLQIERHEKEKKRKQADAKHAARVKARAKKG